MWKLFLSLFSLCVDQYPFPKVTFSRRKLYPSFEGKVSDICAALYWSEVSSISFGAACKNRYHYLFPRTWSFLSLSVLYKYSPAYCLPSFFNVRWWDGGHCMCMCAIVCVHVRACGFPCTNCSFILLVIIRQKIKQDHCHRNSPVCWTLKKKCK